MNLMKINLFLGQTAGSKGSDSVAYDSDTTDTAAADEYDSDATDGSEIDGFIVYSKRCAWV